MSVSAMLIGRLGNSMFQIAASIGYARRYGYEWAAQIYPHNNESAIHRVFPNLPKTDERGISYQEHPSEYCHQHHTHYDQCHFNYHDIPNMGGNVYFRGFFQSYKYFEHCKEEVKQIFKLDHIPGYEDYVSIHVRRGDYVQHSGSFPPLTMEYISKAMNYFLELYNDCKFLVFSDDIQWCKENIKLYATVASGVMTQGETEAIQKKLGEHVKFSEGRNERDDLSLMASCGHHIIANSTFSWWASYLGHNPDRLVISPSAETWFGPTSGVKQPVHDLIPKEWIQIHTR